MLPQSRQTGKTGSIDPIDLITLTDLTNLTNLTDLTTLTTSDHHHHHHHHRPPSRKRRRCAMLDPSQEVEVRTVPLFLLVLPVCVAGCSRPRATASGSEPAKTEVKAALPVAAAPRINCDKLVPEAVRARYFAGATMKQEPMCPGCPEHCKLAKPGEVGAPTVMADCRWGERPSWFAQTKAAWEKQKSYTKVDGIGRAAYKMGTMQFLFVPEGHNCYITITWLGGGDKLVEMARAINSSLTPAALGK